MSRMNNIFEGENGSTTETELFNGSAPISSTTVSIVDVGASVWLFANDILAAVVFVCACAGVLFNISNICIMVISKLYTKITYKLFISQAVSNAINALYYGITYFSNQYTEGKTKLIVAICCYNIAQIGSMTCVLSYTLISLELYYKVILPFKHRFMGFTFEVALILIWVLPVILTESIQVGLTLSQRTQNETFLATYVRLRDNTLGYINTGLALALVIVIIYLNVASLKAVYRSFSLNPREGKSTKKSTITIVAMVTTYIIFYLPNWVLGILFILQYRSQIVVLPSLTRNQRLFLVAFISSLKVLNTISDPIIYVLRIDVIRETYKKLILKLKCY